MAIYSDNLRDRAYQFFIEEAEELLQQLESGLLTLKQERSTPKVHSLMRAAHSIKGGAASVRLETIKDISHRLEDVFRALYNESVEIDTELESDLLAAYDCLRDPLIAQIEFGEFDELAARSKAELIFDRIEAKLGDALERVDDYIPSSSDLGVDMVASIFEIDVAQGIERLEAIIANPENYEIAGELRAQAEVFGGFGELLNLPGFTSISQTATAALDAHPDRALEIIELILVDLRSAREKVLAGERSSGGSASPALLALAEDNNQNKSPVAEYSAENFDSLAVSANLDNEIFNNINLTEEKSFQLQEILSRDGEYKEENTSETEGEWEDSPSLAEIFNNSDIAGEIEEILSREEEFKEENISITKETFPELEENLSLEEIFNNSNIAEEIEEENPLEMEGGLPESSEEIFNNHSGELKNAEFSEKSDQVSQSQQKASKESLALDDIFRDFKAEKSAELENTEASENSSMLEMQTKRSNRFEDIEETVNSIEQIFDRLPSIQDNKNPNQNKSFLGKKAETKSEQTAKIKQDSETSKKTETEKKKKFKGRTNRKRTSSQRSGSGLSVRVDVERLEKMNNLVGELAIERNSLSLQNQQLQSTVRELLNKFVQFKHKTAKIQDISDKMLLSPTSSNNFDSQSNQFEGFLAGETDFDSLEMDSYGATYSALQDLIEEVMQLEEAVDDIVLLSKQSDRSINKQRQMLNYIRDELMWSRMLPLAEVFNRFPRLVRDMSLKFNKSANLKISGDGVLVDKAVLEKLYDPLLHLIRNAFAHGIESPEKRKQLGKHEVGKIEISAYHQGNQTFIEVKDDGDGLNTEKIAKRAIQLGLLTKEQAQAKSKADILEFIFQPGFSTANQVSELSGRGVGLDVVLDQLKSLKGKILVNSSPGEGTTFTLRLPLTLTISKLLICLSGFDAIALPSDSIEEIIIPKSGQLRKLRGQTLLDWQMQVIPVHKLKDLFEYNYPLPHNSITEVFNNTIPTPQSWADPLLLLRRGQEIFALEVDRIVTEQELVIKPFGLAITPPNYLYGCTIVGDGSLVPVINGSILLSLSLEEDRDRQLTIHSDRDDKSAIDKKQKDSNWGIVTVLIVDDSSALRRTLALSLQKATYRVLLAKDGKEAIDKLEQNPRVNLIICDIEMPNMNGFEFLSYRRQKPEIAQIPTAILTSRSSTKHYKLAMQLEADAYFSKPYVESELLEAIEQILNPPQSETIPSDEI